MKEITSKENPIIKHIVKLKEKKYRKEFEEYIIEGAKIVKEAIEEQADIKYIILDDKIQSNELIKKHLSKYLKNIDYIQVPSSIFKLISDVEQPQGVMAVISKKSESNMIDYSADLILALDDIQDPGNLGTIIRTADSIGLTQLLVSKGTVDAFCPKVIRSTMGAIFRVNIIECDDLVKTLSNAKRNNFNIMVTSLQAKKSIFEIDLKKNVVVIGNEAKGVSQELIGLSNNKVIIPMVGKTESLNASIATGVILYEYIRQKLYE